MSRPVREVGLHALGALGMVAAARWRNRRTAVVVTYHAVTEVDPSLCLRFPFVYRNAVTVDQLRAHIAHLKRHYHLLDAEEFLECLARARFPERSAMLTFDDGLRCHATLAAPLLASEGVPGVVFLATGLTDEATSGRVGWQWTEALAALVYTRGDVLRRQWRTVRDHLGAGPEDVGRETTDDRLIRCIQEAFWRLDWGRRAGALHELAGLVGGLPHPGDFPADVNGTSVLAAMSWEEARALASQGVEAGGHTVHHPRLSELSCEEVEQEILGCAERIRQECARPARVFAYPYGDYGDEGALEGTFRRAGIRAAMTQRYGLVAATVRPYFVPRVNVPGNCGWSRLAYHASGLRALVARAGLAAQPTELAGTQQRRANRPNLLHDRA